MHASLPCRSCKHHRGGNYVNVPAAVLYGEGDKEDATHCCPGIIDGKGGIELVVAAIKLIKP